ncbi:MAG: family 20 glycosylhydrolase [bacterium]|nr:family 20 glycosylhydrolase [bacterium]
MTVTHSAASTDGKYNGNNVDIADVTVTVTDEDSASSSIQLLSRDVEEDGGELEITLGLGSEPVEDVTVTITSSDITKVLVDGSDSDTTGSRSETVVLTASNWDTGQVFTVIGVDDDLDNSGDKRTASVSFSVSSSDTRYSSITFDPIPIDVIDDEATPAIDLSVNPTSVAESAGATSVTVTATVQGTVRFDAARTVVVSVDGSGASGVVGFSAVADFDVIIASGAVSGNASFTLTPETDSVDENNETITVSGTSAGPPVAVITSTTLSLTDDDASPTAVTLSVDTDTTAEGNQDSITEDDSATTVRVTATITSATRFGSSQDITVVVGASTDSAIEGPDDDEDYEAVANQTITIPAGAVSAYTDFTLTPTDDFRSEPLKTISITGNLTGVTVSPTAITINDDDQLDVQIQTLGNTIKEDVSVPDRERMQQWRVGLARNLISPEIVDVPLVISGDGIDTTDYMIALKTNETNRGVSLVSGDTLTPIVRFTGPTEYLNTNAWLLVTAQDDDVDEGQETITITVGDLDDENLNTNLPDSVDLGIEDDGDDSTNWGTFNITIIDDDTSAVTINESTDTFEVAEGGSDTYEVVLDTKPSNDVVVDLESDDTAIARVTPAKITFTSGNWNTAQTITVTGTEDLLDNPGDKRTATITHEISSTDLKYNALADQEITVTVTDNDAAPSAITLSVDADISTQGTQDSIAENGSAKTVRVTASLNGTTRFASEQTITIVVGAASDSATEDDGQPSTEADYATVPNQTITLAAGAVSGHVDFTLTPENDTDDEPAEAITVTGELAGITFTPTTITIIDNDITTVTLSRAAGASIAEGDTLTYTVELSRQLVSNETVVVPLSVATGAGAATLGTDYTLRCSSGQTTIACTENQGSTNSELGSITITGASETSTAQITLSAIVDDISEPAGESVDITIGSVISQYLGGGAAGIGPHPASLTILDAPGVRPSQTSVEVGENGDTVTYELVLAIRPTHDVVVALASDTISAATVSPASITFNVSGAKAWNVPQEITVTGVDDIIDNPGNKRTANITHTVTSSDSGYSGITVDNVEVTIVDDDDNALVVVPASKSLTVNEGARTTYSVGLAQRPQSNVTMTVTNPDTAILEIAYDGTSGATVTVPFTTSDWSSKNISVTARDNDVANLEADLKHSIQHRLSGGGFSSSSNFITKVKIVDDEAAGIKIVQSGGSTRVTEVAGSSNTDTYTLSLTSKPTHDVSFKITAGTGIKLRAPGSSQSQTALDITIPVNGWDTLRTITVVGQDDAAVQQPTYSSTITHVATSADANYHGSSQSIPVSIVDDDSYDLIITESSGSTQVTEASGAGNSDTYMIALNAQPTHNVSVAIAAESGIQVQLPGGSFGAGGTVTFTRTSYQTKQTINVRAVDNAVDNSVNPTKVITHTLTSRDTNYSGTTKRLSVTVVDNDTADFIVAHSSGGSTTVAELNGTGSFTVKLSSSPAARVRIGVSSGDVSALTVSPSSLVYDSSNWNTARQVTVTGQNDNVDNPNNGRAVSVSLNPSGSVDTVYRDLDTQSVRVFVTDDDGAIGSVGVAAAPRNVIPRLRSWTAQSGVFRLAPESAVWVSTGRDAERWRNSNSVNGKLLAQRKLKDVAETIKEDLEAVTLWDFDVPSQRTSVQAGDIVLDLADAVDTQLGYEGYELIVGDYITIRANTSMGVFWGSRTLLQMLAQVDGSASVQKGTARDWPTVEMRHIMVDAGRKFFEVDYLKDLFRLMSWYKLNSFQLHFSEGEGFRLNDPVKYPGLAHPDASYSRADIQELELLGDEYFVDIMPGFDFPGHATAVSNHFGIGFGSNRSDGVAPCTTSHIQSHLTPNFVIDMTSTAARNKVKEVMDHFIPWFNSPYVHTGADEVAKQLASCGRVSRFVSSNSSRFAHVGDVLVDFINEMNDTVRAHNKQMMIYNGFENMRRSTDSDIAPSKQKLDTNIVINLWEAHQDALRREYRWSCGCSTGNYELLYMVANTNRFYLTPNHFHHLHPDPNTLYTWPNVEHPSNSEYIGYAISVWADYQFWGDDEYFERLLRRPRAIMADRIWNGTNVPDTLTSFYNRLNTVGDPPSLIGFKRVRVNDQKPSHYYTFERRNYPPTHTYASRSPHTILLHDAVGGLHGSSQIQSNPGIDDSRGVLGSSFSFNSAANHAVGIGGAEIDPPWTVSVWVYREDPNDYAGTLLTARQPDGTYRHIHLYAGGNRRPALGLATRNAWFTYNVPLKQWTNLTYVATASSTLLYANGVYVARVPESIALPMGALNSPKGGASSMHGNLDELKIFDEALTAAQVRDVYNSHCTSTAYHHWTFDGQTGGTAWLKDSGIANAQVGTGGAVYHGNPTINGRSTQSLRLIPTTNRGENPQNARLVLNRRPLAVSHCGWTAAMWIKRNADYPESVLFSNKSAADWRVKLEQWQNTRRIGFSKRGVGDFSFNYSAPRSTWVHIALVGTATNTTLYVNGARHSSINQSFDLPQHTIGADSKGENPVHAEIDELRIYPSSLSNNQIRDLYNGYSSGTTVRITETGGSNDTKVSEGVSSALVAQVRGYAAETSNGADHVRRWNRVLLAFGEDVPGFTGTPITASEAQDNADKGWARWIPVAAALLALQDNYFVGLSAAPLADVTVSVSAGAGILVDGPDAGTAGSTTEMLRFTPSNWNTQQQVRVMAVDNDLDQPATRTVQITHAAASEDDRYNLGAAGNVTVTITDEDSAAVLISETSDSTEVTEAQGTSNTDSYQVVLGSEPTADVSITVTASAGVLLGTGSSTETLLFTPSNWNVAQTVTVTGVDDAVDQPPTRTVQITHVASSSDTAYRGITIPSVSVKVTDDEVLPAPLQVLAESAVTGVGISWSAPVSAGGAIAGYDVQYRRKSVTNWTDHTHSSTATTATVSGLIGGATYVFRVRARNAAGAGLWSQEVEQTPKAAADALPTIVLTASSVEVDEGDPAVFTLMANKALSGSLDVNVFVLGGPTFGVQQGAQTVTLPASGSLEISLATTDDNIDEADSTVLVFASAGTGYIPDPFVASTIVADDDSTEVSLARRDTTALSESTGTTQLAVTLARNLMQGEQVDVPLAISGSGVTAEDYTLSLLTSFGVNVGVELINADTLTPIVRLSGRGARTAVLVLAALQDEIDEGSSETLNFAFGNLSSSTLGTNISGGVLAHTSTNSFSVSIADDDAAGLVAAHSSGGATRVAEQAGVGRFGVRLSTKPVSDVTVEVSSEDSSALQISPAVLNFNTLDWNRLKYVQVIGQDDDIDNPGNERVVQVSFDFSSSADSVYSALSDAQVPVSVTDDDVGGVTTAGAPEVVPRVRSWTAGATGSVTLSASSRIVVDSGDADLHHDLDGVVLDSTTEPWLFNRSLEDVANQFKKDLKQAVGLDLPVVKASSGAIGDVFLSLSDTIRLDWGTEGYSLNASDLGRVAISANTSTGVFYGTRTLLQMLKQSDGQRSVQHGSIVDWPGEDLRMVLVDAGRKYFSIEYLEDMIREMAWMKMNAFVLHFSEREAFRLYSPKAMYNGLADDDVAYSEAEIKALDKLAREHHVMLIPGFNFPGHANALSNFFEIGLGSPNERNEAPCTESQIKKNPSYIIDMTSTEAKTIVTQILNDFIPWFSSSPFVHLGADEVVDTIGACPRVNNYVNNNSHLLRSGDMMMEFLNDMNATVKSHSKQSIIWNGVETLRPGSISLDRDVIVMPWEGSAIDRAGYKPYDVISSVFEDGYYLTPTLTGAYYWEPKYLYNGSDATNFGGYYAGSGGGGQPYHPNIAGHPKQLGLSLAVWPDQMFWSQDEFFEKHMYPGRAAAADRWWNESEPQDTITDFYQRLDNIGKAPGHVGFPKPPRVNNQYPSYYYNFDHSTWPSGIHYPKAPVRTTMLEEEIQGVHGHAATFEKTYVSSDGVVGESWVIDNDEGGINLGNNDIEPPWTASIWVKPNKARDNAVLLSTLDPYTHDYFFIHLELHGSRKVAITKYANKGSTSQHYYFDYVVPMNQWTHLTFVAGTSEILLYVNGVHNSTIATSMPLPLMSIGYADWHQGFVNRTGSVNSPRAQLDEFKVFDEALNAEQVKALHVGVGEPEVVPRLRSWESGGSVLVTLSASSQIVGDSSISGGAYRRSGSEVTAKWLSRKGLKDVADKLKKDLKEVAGLDLAVVAGASGSAGNIFLSYLDTYDSELGAEGYSLNSSVAGGVVITANTSTGLFYGTRTLLQILKQYDGQKSVPSGSIRDWPGDHLRMVLVDAGRKYFSIEYLEDLIREMAWMKMNAFVLHFSEREAFRLYSPDAEYVGLADDDVAYSEAEIKALDALAQEHHLTLVPGFNFPGHATALSNFFEIGLASPNERNEDPCVQSNIKKEPSYIIDMTSTEARTRVNEILNRFIPWFTSPFVHLGADEVPSTIGACPRIYNYVNNNSHLLRSGDLMLEFINMMNATVKTHNKQSIIWNGVENLAPGSLTLDRDVIMMPWEGSAFSRQGYKPYETINSVFTHGNYLTPSLGEGALFLEPKFLYNGSDATNFGGYYTGGGGAPSSYNPASSDIRHPKQLGFSLAVWPDQMFWSRDEFFEKHMYPGRAAVADRWWNHTEPQDTINDFYQRLDNIGHAPGYVGFVKPARVNDQKPSYHYNFDHSTWPSGMHWPQGGEPFTTMLEEKIQSIHGHRGSFHDDVSDDAIARESWVIDDGTTGVNLGNTDIEPPWTAGIWVNPHAARANAVLLATLDPYTHYYSFIHLELHGSRKVAVTNNVTNRDGTVTTNHYYFDYVVPMNQWTHLTFVAGTAEIMLYVNGTYNSKVDTSMPLPLMSIGYMDWRQGYLGRSGSINSPRAKLDELKVFDEALSAAQVTDLYSSHCTAEAAEVRHHWTFDDENDVGKNSGTSNTTAKFVGYTTTGATYGYNSRGLRFDPTASGAQPPTGPGRLVVDQPSVNVSRCGWTVAMWVNLQRVSRDAVLLSTNSTADWRVKLQQYVEANQLSDIEKLYQIGFSKRGVGDFRLNFSPPLTTWTHIAIVGTASQTYLYVNGQQRNQIARSFDLPLHTIGADADGSAPIHADIDDIQIYASSLSGTQITALYNTYNTTDSGSSELDALSADAAVGVEPDVADPYVADPVLVATVQGYAAEADSGEEHVTRWNRVLLAFGVEVPGFTGTPMTVAEAQGYVDRGWERWVPVLEALKALEANSTAADDDDSEAADDDDSVPSVYVVPLRLVADVRRFAAEVDSGEEHVTRWNRVLLAFGVEVPGFTGTPMTVAEAQGYVDRGWERWVPVLEALKALEANSSAADETTS